MSRVVLVAGLVTVSAMVTCLAGSFVDSKKQTTLRTLVDGIRGSDVALDAQTVVELARIVAGTATKGAGDGRTNRSRVRVPRTDTRRQAAYGRDVKPNHRT